MKKSYLPCTKCGHQAYISKDGHYSASVYYIACGMCGLRIFGEDAIDKYIKENMVTKEVEEVRPVGWPYTEEVPVKVAHNKARATPAKNTEKPPLKVYENPNPGSVRQAPSKTTTVKLPTPVPAAPAPKKGPSNSARAYKGETVTCDYCGQPYVMSAKNRKRGSKQHFCSADHYKAWRKQGSVAPEVKPSTSPKGPTMVVLTCAYCDLQFPRQKRLVKARTVNHFCSREHSVAFRTGERPHAKAL